MDSRKGKALFQAMGVLIALFLLTGCAAQTVRHLNRSQWKPETRQELVMDYVRFEYVSQRNAEGITVTGNAFPLAESVPEWAEWMEDLWIAGYLSDEGGEVLAKDIRLYTSRSLDFDRGIPFAFTLAPEEMGEPGPVYITFGYRLVLTALNPKKRKGPLGTLFDEKHDTFFASESALSQF